MFCRNVGTHAPNVWAGRAQSVWQLATGCTVWGSNPGGREGGTPHRSGPALGPTQLHTQWLTALSRGGKTAGGVALTTHTSCSTQVKERVQLQFYSPLWAFTVCSRVSCAFTTFTNLHCNKLRHHHVLPTFHFVFLQSSCSSRDSSASIVT